MDLLLGYKIIVGRTTTTITNQGREHLSFEKIFQRRNNISRNGRVRLGEEEDDKMDGG